MSLLSYHRRWGAVLGGVVLLVLAGCAGDGDPAEDLPAADELLVAAADEMATVSNARIALRVDTDLADLPVREVAGVLTRAGDAEGTATLEQFDTLLELEFVVVDEVFHYRLVGGWQELPLSRASLFYDPSAILDPERGLAHLLRTATNAEVTGVETVAEVRTYRVSADLGAPALATLVPGSTSGVRGTLWIEAGERPRLRQARFPVPAPPEGEGAGREAGTATVTLSDFDGPVTISAP